MGLISVDHSAYGALKLEPEARAVFRHEREVFFRKDRPQAGRKAKAGGSPAARERAELGSAAVGADPVVRDVRPARTRRETELGQPQRLVVMKSASQAEVFLKRHARHGSPPYNRRKPSERLSVAKDLAVPPYVVFPDTTLIALAKERPRDREELLDIPGIGVSKRDRFGDAFLAVIDEFTG